MQKVKKIGVLSLAKILGLLYAIMGLIVGAFLAIFAPVGMGALYFGGAGVAIFPIFYGILGFIGGLITAFFYNLIASKVGGLEVEITK